MSRSRRNRQTQILVLGAAVVIFAVPALYAQAPRTKSGLTLVVPEEQTRRGTVYYVLPGKDAQVTFTSDAPLERIKGTTDQVVGYTVVSDDGTSGLSLAAGVFRLPVKSFDTGISTRNEHMQGSRWLDAKAHPDIVYTVSGVNGVKVAKSGSEFTTYSVTLVGDLNLKGTSRKLSVPARITMMPQNERTQGRAPGDLMAIRCTFVIKMSDFAMAVNDPAIKAAKISDEIELDTFLLLSSVSPD